MQRLALPVRAPPASQRNHISHSSISTFASCPLRYYFRYELHLPEETVGSSLAVGSALHAGVELHFNELLAGNSPPGLDALLGVFWDSWRDQQEEKAIVVGPGEDINSVGHLADRMFRAFQSSDFARPQGTIIGVEEEVRAELLPDVPELLARIDLLIETEEELTVVDFKTARSAWSYEQVQAAAGQLLLYHEAVQPIADGRPVRLQFAVLTKTKVPSLVLHDVAVDPRKIKRTKEVVNRVWQAIQSGHVYPNPSILNCSTCPYRKPCEQWAA